MIIVTSLNRDAFDEEFHIVSHAVSPFDREILKLRRLQELDNQHSAWIRMFSGPDFSINDSELDGWTRYHIYRAAADAALGGGANAACARNRAGEYMFGNFYRPVTPGEVPWITFAELLDISNGCIPAEYFKFIRAKLLAMINNDGYRRQAHEELWKRSLLFELNFTQAEFMKMSTGEDKVFNDNFFREELIEATINHGGRRHMARAYVSFVHGDDSILYIDTMKLRELRFTGSNPPSIHDTIDDVREAMHKAYINHNVQQLLRTYQELTAISLRRAHEIHVKLVAKVDAGKALTELQHKQVCESMRDTLKLQRISMILQHLARHGYAPMGWSRNQIDQRRSNAPPRDALPLLRDAARAIESLPGHYHANLTKNIQGIIRTMAPSTPAPPPTPVSSIFNVSPATVQAEQAA